MKKLCHIDTHLHATKTQNYLFEASELSTVLLPHHKQDTPVLDSMPSN
jgi:hypothetical protein